MNYYAASHVFTRQLVEEVRKSYWLSPGGKPGQFIMDLGCRKKINTIELVNTHNAHRKDCSTKGFQVYLG